MNWAALAYAAACGIPAAGALVVAAAQDARRDGTYTYLRVTQGRTDGMHPASEDTD